MNRIASLPQVHAYFVCSHFLIINICSVIIKFALYNIAGDEDGYFPLYTREWNVSNNHYSDDMVMISMCSN